MKVFLNNYCLRPSCYFCPSKSGKADSDITLADFWGIETCYPNFDDDKGVSLVIANSLRGEKFLMKNMGNMDFIEVDASTAFAHNRGYFKSVTIPPKREDFWRMLNSDIPMNKIIRKLLPVTLKKRVKSVLKKLLKHIYNE